MDIEDANATTTTAAAPVETVAAPPAEKMIPQSEVNALIGQRLAEDRKRREAPVQSKPADRVGDTDLRGELEEMKLRNAFDKRAAKLDISDGATERLFKLYKVDRPDDPSVWFAETSKEFGLKGPSMNPTTPIQNMEPAKPAAVAPNAPSRVDQLTSGGLVDIYSMSDEQFRAMTPAAIRQAHESNIAAATHRSGAPPVPQHKR